MNGRGSRGPRLRLGGGGFAPAGALLAPPCRALHSRPIWPSPLAVAGAALGAANRSRGASGCLRLFSRRSTESGSRVRKGPSVLHARRQRPRLVPPPRLGHLRPEADARPPVSRLAQRLTAVPFSLTFVPVLARAPRRALSVRGSRSSPSTRQTPCAPLRSTSVGVWVRGLFGSGGNAGGLAHRSRLLPSRLTAVGVGVRGVARPRSQGVSRPGAGVGSGVRFTPALISQAGRGRPAPHLPGVGPDAVGH